MTYIFAVFSILIRIEVQLCWCLPCHKYDRLSLCADTFFSHHKLEIKQYILFLDIAEDEFNSSVNTVKVSKTTMFNIQVASFKADVSV